MTDDAVPIEQQAFCASCFSPVDESIEICSHCGTSLAQPATAKKINRTETQRPPRKNGTQPSLLIVIGMWLVLLPGLVIAFGALIEPTDARVRTSIVIGLMFWAYGVVLNRVTRRYLAARHSIARDVVATAQADREPASARDGQLP